jgi:hypothetical protein
MLINMILQTATFSPPSTSKWWSPT